MHSSTSFFMLARPASLQDLYMCTCQHSTAIKAHEHEYVTRLVLPKNCQCTASLLARGLSF